VEICDNDIDDDGDGLIDCEDPDCQDIIVNSTPTCQQIDLTVSGGTAPYTYQWSDMSAPTAHWTFENTTDDISGNGNHQNLGSSLGTVAYVADAVEGQNALSLDGSTYLRYSQDGAFMEIALTEFMISFWMKPATLSGTQFIFDEGGITNGMALRLNGNTLEFATRDGGVDFQKNAGTHTIPNDGAWHHVAAVYANDSIQLFLDGVAGLATYTGYPNSEISAHSGNGGIGQLDDGAGFGGGSGNFYTGLLDDFRFFHNASLSADQIADLANNNGNRTNLSPGTYYVTVEDSDGGCATTDTIQVGENCATLDPDVCYLISDGAGDGYIVPDTFFTFNPTTGVLTVIGETGTLNAEALAIDKDNELIYTATGDTFGTININTGVFSPIANDIGSLDGSAGVLNINDIDGMSYDVVNNIIWASARRSGDGGLPDDLIFKIDPTSGLALPNAFGAGVGYLVIATPEHDLDDLALDTDGTLYAISNLGDSGNQRLGIINKTTGAWTEIGDYGVEDVESLAFTASGQLVATTGEDGSDKNRLYSIDAASATATLINNLGIAHDVEGCVCENANFINLQIGDKVWADLDNDGIQDLGEPGVENVVVNLLDGAGSPVLDASGNPRTITTDSNGAYRFDRLTQGEYRIEFVKPVGTTFTSKDNGADDALDSDADATTGRTGVITLIKSMNNLDADAGLLNADVTERTCVNAGELFVSDVDNGNILRYNQNTGALIDTFIRGFDSPVHMVAGPDNWLYVTDSDLNEIRIYSLVTGSLVNIITSNDLLVFVIP